MKNIAMIRTLLASKSALATMALFVSAAAGSAAALAGTKAPDTAQEIVTLERELGAALSRVDLPLIDKMWAPDLQYISPGGAVLDKTQRMAAMAASKAAPSVVSSVDDVKVRVYGNTAVAIVKTTWRGSRDGKDFADSFIATHVWVKSAPGWRLAGAQVTPIAAKLPRDG